MHQQIRKYKESQSVNIDQRKYYRENITSVYLAMVTETVNCIVSGNYNQFTPIMSQ